MARMSLPNSKLRIRADTFMASRSTHPLITGPMPSLRPRLWRSNSYWPGLLPGVRRPSMVMAPTLLMRPARSSPYSTRALRSSTSGRMIGSPVSLGACGGWTRGRSSRWKFQVRAPVSSTKRTRGSIARICVARSSRRSMRWRSYST
jgi:hypothetical protein